MGAEAVGTGTRATIAAVRRQVPTLGLVFQARDHDLLENLLVNGRVLDWYQSFHPTVQVTRHPVGRGDEDLGLRGRQAVAVSEADDPAMLEKPADDALDMDVVGEARNLGAQAATMSARIRLVTAS